MTKKKMMIYPDLRRPNLFSFADLHLKVLTRADRTSSQYQPSDREENRQLARTFLTLSSHSHNPDQLHQTKIKPWIAISRTRRTMMVQSFTSHLLDCRASPQTSHIQDLVHLHRQHHPQSRDSTRLQRRTCEFQHHQADQALMPSGTPHTLMSGTIRIHRKSLWFHLARTASNPHPQLPQRCLQPKLPHHPQNVAAPRSKPVRSSTVRKKA